MHNFLLFLKSFRIPKRKNLSSTLNSFSKKELLIFSGILCIAIVTLVILVMRINAMFLVEVPGNDDTITEGIIGIPTLVNPVMAVSDADKDLSAIVYSGLMRKKEDGSFIPDLAQSYSVSPDGMHYTFVLKKNAVFHDKTPVTADDIIFTVSKIKDPLVKSPRKIGWDGVTIEKVDDQTVVFTLKQPYISFMDNTTIGILPMHIWKDVTPAEFGLSTLNIKAIGSGPFSILDISKNSDGVPEEYTLKRFDQYTLGKSHIKYLKIISFANEKDVISALIDNSIDQAGGLSPENAVTIKNAGYTIKTATVPRLFGLFFNSANNPIFADANVRKAFDQAIDRKTIVDTVLYGFGTPIDNPIPSTILPIQNNTDTRANLDYARTLLDKSGWTVGADGIRVKGSTTTVTIKKRVGKKIVTTTSKIPSKGPKQELAFTITTGDTPELKQSANLIQSALASIGARVDIKVYGTGELNTLIRTRNYQALFFGQIVNHESDLYSFWDSSQKNDPGLNIAMYTNKNVDTLLEANQKTLDRASRINRYEAINDQFKKDLPALLIYSPRYLYAISKHMNMNLDTITIPSDRFVSIHTWYASVDRVWKIFTK